MPIAGEKKKGEGFTITKKKNKKKQKIGTSPTVKGSPTIVVG